MYPVFYEKQLVIVRYLETDGNIIKHALMYNNV